MGGKQNHKAKSVSFYKSKQIKSDKKWKEGLFLPVIHNSVWNSAPPFQHHFVRIDVNGAKGLAVWSCFDNPFYVDMVHTVRVLRVAAIVSVAGEEAHHTLVRPNDRQGVSVIPGQAHSVRGFRVNGKMAHNHHLLLVSVRECKNFVQPVQLFLAKSTIKLDKLGLMKSLIVHLPAE